MHGRHEQRQEREREDTCEHALALHRTDPRFDFEPRVGEGGGEREGGRRGEENVCVCVYGRVTWLIFTTGKIIIISGEQMVC